MGGNLFKLGRLPQADYIAIETEMKAHLDQIVGGQYRIPRYYADKADFGDLDVLISSAAAPEGWERFRKTLLAELGIERYKHENRLLSTVYRNFQVDFFHVDIDVFESTYQFLCFNDLGNILGKIFRRFNLKYGEDGLSYVYRRPDNPHYRKDILLTRDMGRILSFIGLDPKRWEDGFSSLDDMFAWVVGSKYFSVSPFLDRSKATEQRVQKRTTMLRFVSWLEKEGISKEHHFMEDRKDNLPLILAAFPDATLDTQLLDEEARHSLAQKVNAKFNGRLVMEMFPELAGEKLGRFMQHFKSRFDDFERAMQALSEAEVAELLRHERTSWGG